MESVSKRKPGRLTPVGWGIIGNALEIFVEIIGTAKRLLERRAVSVRLRGFAKSQGGDMRFRLESFLR